MSRMEFINLGDVNIQAVNSKAVLIDHEKLEEPVWLPRSTLASKSDREVETATGNIDIRVHKWIVEEEDLWRIEK